jgi:hypothetical protein
VPVEEPLRTLQDLRHHPGGHQTPYGQRINSYQSLSLLSALIGYRAVSATHSRRMWQRCRLCSSSSFRGRVTYYAGEPTLRQTGLDAGRRAWTEREIGGVMRRSSAAASRSRNHQKKTNNCINAVTRNWGKEPSRREAFSPPRSSEHRELIL